MGFRLLDLRSINKKDMYMQREVQYTTHTRPIHTPFGFVVVSTVVFSAFEVLSVVTTAAAVAGLSLALLLVALSLDASAQQLWFGWCLCWRQNTLWQYGHLISTFSLLLQSSREQG